VFHVFGALAEFERDLIRERTIAGLQAARARGRQGGRPTVWTTDKLKVARELYDGGEHDVATIARVVGVSRASSTGRSVRRSHLRTSPPEPLRPLSPSSGGRGQAPLFCVTGA
jgi:DNA invertase Pin-like site-specific DNA recombinase